MNKKVKYLKDKTKLPGQSIIKWLLTGEFSFEIPQDKESQRAIWQKNRENILSAWLETLQGCRPFGFWLFDVQEPRRCISDVHLYDTQDFPDALKRFCFGLPTIHDRRGRQAFESEFDYLERMELLTDAEKDLNPDRMRENSCYGYRLPDDPKILQTMKKLGF